MAVIDLNVDGQVDDDFDWTKVGASPYLDAADDGNHIYHNVQNEKSRYFTFPDIPYTYEVSSVILWVRLKHTATGVTRIEVWNGAWGNFKEVTDGTDWVYRSYDVTALLNSIAKINAARVGFIRVNAGGFTTYIDHCYLRVTYTIKPKLTAKVDNVTMPALRAELNMLGLTVGHSLATILVDDTDVYSYGINDPVEVYNQGILVFNGKLDDAHRDESQDVKWNKQPIVRVSARDLSREFSNLKVTKIYEDTIKADDLIEDLMTEAGCSDVSFTSGSTAPTLDGFVANDEYLLPLIKRILEQVGWEGYVDAAGDLQLFDASNPPDSEITLADGDIIGKLYNKSGLGIRNKIKVIGAPLSFDPDGSGVQGWKDNCESLTGWTEVTGTLTLIAGTKSPNQLQCVADANGTRIIQFELAKVFKAGFNDERKRLYFIIQQALSGTPAPTFLAGKISLVDSDGDYFYIEFEPEDTPAYTEIDEVLGVGNEYIEGQNETGWKLNGTPSWNKIIKILFEYQYTLGTAGTAIIRVDRLYLEPVKWVYECNSAASIALYDERQLTLERPDLLTQAECDAYGDEQLILYKDYIGGWRMLVPADKLISGGVWKGLVGSKLMYALTETRITSTTIICAPRENLKDGFDFICRVNLLPLADRPKIYLYDITLNPNHMRILVKK